MTITLQRKAHKAEHPPRESRSVRVPLLVFALLVAGCAAPSPPEPAATAPPAGPACEAPRAALAHGGPPAPAASGPALCAFRTGYAGTESTLGVCPATGAVFAGPVFERGKGGGLVRTLDGGATWEFLFPHVGGQGTHVNTLDPYLHVDAATCRVFFDDLQTVNCSLLSWSDDEGGTWAHSASGCAEFDHQTIFTGPPVSSPTVGYPNVVYRCAINLVATGGGSTAATCQRSLDGGVSWLPPGAPAFLVDPTERGHNNAYGTCDGAHGHGVADASGRVYLPKGCSQPRLAWSDDEGLTWTRVQVSDLGMNMGPDGLLDHEGAVGVDAAGNVYYAWIAADHLPWLVVSRDRGETWGEPVALAPPGLLHAVLPTLAVTPEGRVGVSYYGSYDVPETPAVPPCEQDPAGCVQRFFVGAGALEGTWLAHVALVPDALGAAPTVWTATASDEPFIVGACGPVRCQEAFDFQDLQMGPDGAAWATFVDAPGGGANELVVVRLG